MQCAACQIEVHPVKEMYGPGVFISKCPRAECGAPMDDAPTISVNPDAASELQGLQNELDMLSGVENPNAEERQSLMWVRQRIMRLKNPPPPALAMAVTEALSAARPVAAPVPSPSAPDAPVDFFDQVRARLVAIDAQVADLEKLKAEARKLRAMLAAAEAADAN
jgi:hypothetical protein